MMNKSYSQMTPALARDTRIDENNVWQSASMEYNENGPDEENLDQVLYEYDSPPTSCAEAVSRPANTIRRGQGQSRAATLEISPHHNPVEYQIPSAYQSRERQSSATGYGAFVPRTPASIVPNIGYSQGSFQLPESTRVPVPSFAVPLAEEISWQVPTEVLDPPPPRLDGIRNFDKPHSYREHDLNHMVDIRTGCRIDLPDLGTLDPNLVTSSFESSLDRYLAVRRNLDLWSKELIYKAQENDQILSNFVSQYESHLSSGPVSCDGRFPFIANLIHFCRNGQVHSFPESAFGQPPQGFSRPPGYVPPNRSGREQPDLSNMQNQAYHGLSEEHVDTLRAEEAFSQIKELNKGPAQTPAVIGNRSGYEQPDLSNMQNRVYHSLSKEHIDGSRVEEAFAQLRELNKGPEQIPAVIGKPKRKRTKKANPPTSETSENDMQAPRNTSRNKKRQKLKRDFDGTAGLPITKKQAEFLIRAGARDTTNGQWDKTFSTQQ